MFERTNTRIKKFSKTRVHFLNYKMIYLGYSDRTPTSARPDSSLHAESLLLSRLPRVFIDGIEREDTGFRSYKKVRNRNIKLLNLNIS